MSHTQQFELFGFPFAPEALTVAVPGGRRHSSTSDARAESIGPATLASAKDEASTYVPRVGTSRDKGSKGTLARHYETSTMM